MTDESTEEEQHYTREQILAAVGAMGALGGDVTFAPELREQLEEEGYFDDE